MLDFIRQRLAASVPFAKHAMVEIVTIDDQGATTRIVDHPELKNHVGTVHAGALFTLGETASGAVVAGAFAAKLLSIRPVTRDAHIRYLKPATGPITARATIDGDIAALRAALDADGRVDIAVSVAMTDEAGITVATLAVDWSIRGPAA